VSFNKMQKSCSCCSTGKPLASILGEPIASDEVQHFIRALNFHKIQHDQYAFLPHTRVYHDIDREFPPNINAKSDDGLHTEIFTSKVVPLMIKAEKDENNVSRVSLVSIGEYNLSGVKVRLEKILLNYINERLICAGYYLPYEILMITNPDDARSLLFWPYATRQENDYPEGFRITAIADNQPLKFPIEIWFEIDKPFCINLKKGLRASQ